MFQVRIKHMDKKLIENVKNFEMLEINLIITLKSQLYLFSLKLMICQNCFNRSSEETVNNKSVEVEDELADVLIYCISMSDKLDIVIEK